jgi:hypothetical protein
MKKTLLLVSAILFTALSSHAQIDPLKAGGKVISKAKESKDSKPSDTKTTSKSTADIKGSDTGPDLFAKGEKSFEEEKWQEALDYFEAAEGKGYNDGMMKMKMNKCKENLASSPEDKAKKEREISNILGKLDEKKSGIDPVPDQGFLNDFHKENAGKIVFSATEIDKSITNGSQLKNKFNSTEDIYGRVYLPKSIANESYALGYDYFECYYRISVDGHTFSKTASLDNFITNPNQSGKEDLTYKWTTFQTGLSPKASDIQEYPFSLINDFFCKMYELPDGNHKVKVEMLLSIWRKEGNLEKVIASGDFEINMSKAGRQAMGAKACPKLSYLNNHNNLLPNCFEVVSSAKNIAWENWGWTSEELLKVKIIGNDWKYNKNSFGVILSRELRGMAIIKNTKTGLCAEIPLIFHQENTSSGGSTYGKTTFYKDNKAGTDDYFFIEDCIKK